MSNPWKTGDFFSVPLAAWADEVEARLAKLEKVHEVLKSCKLAVTGKGLTFDGVPVVWDRPGGAWVTDELAALLRKQHYAEALESAAKMLMDTVLIYGRDPDAMECADRVRAHKVEEKP